jgi:hypothetical protein
MFTNLYFVRGFTKLYYLNQLEIERVDSFGNFIYCHRLLLKFFSSYDELNLAAGLSQFTANH